jgi:iron-sulfur cluster assembly protein
MLTEQTQIESITLTPAAVAAVRGLLEQRNLKDYALRVFISGGGCSGFQYGMALENNIRDEDITNEFDGVKVVVDEVSIEYLHGATVDFVETPQGTGFKIDNPNSMPSCGCGSAASSDEAGGCSGCS